MDNGVSWYDGQDGEVVMTEVDSVEDAEGLGFCINVAMAAVMLQGDTNVESVRATLWVMTGQPSWRRGVAL